MTCPGSHRYKKRWGCSPSPSLNLGGLLSWLGLGIPASSPSPVPPGLLSLTTALREATASFSDLSCHHLLGSPILLFAPLWLCLRWDLVTTSKDICLSQWFLPGGNSALQGMSGNVWGHFWLSQLGLEGAIGFEWVETREAAQHAPPATGDDGFQMSIVLKTRTLP